MMPLPWPCHHSPLAARDQGRSTMGLKRENMRFIKWVLGIVVGLAVLTAGIGFLLPGKYVVSRSITINTAPDRVYALLEDPRRWKDWMPWHRRDTAMTISPLGAERGVEKGVGAGSAWKSNTEGASRLRLTSTEPGRRLSFEWQKPERGTTALGEFRLAAAGLGTRVSWTHSADAGDNPFDRWAGVFADGLTGTDLANGLANLKALAERP